MASAPSSHYTSPVLFGRCCLTRTFGTLGLMALQWQEVGTVANLQS